MLHALSKAEDTLEANTAKTAIAILGSADMFMAASDDAMKLDDDAKEGADAEGAALEAALRLEAPAVAFQPPYPAAG